MASTKTAASKFAPVFAQCDSHGTWQQNVLGEDGVVRWLPQCPRCAQEANTRHIIDSVSIPMRFQNCRFENYIAELPGQIDALAVTRDYANKFEEALRLGRCLVLVGGVGTGKSHLAFAIRHHVNEIGYCVIYRTASDLIALIRDTWAPTAALSESELLRSLDAIDLLIIDEIGAGYGKGSEQVELFKIINRRYENVKPTIILSNLDRAGLKGALGERSFDRLRENEGRAVVFDWGSYRGVK